MTYGDYMLYGKGGPYDESEPEKVARCPNCQNELYPQGWCGRCGWSSETNAVIHKINQSAKEPVKKTTK